MFKVRMLGVAVVASLAGSVYAEVREELSIESLGQQRVQFQMAAAFHEFALYIRILQEAFCAGEITIAQVDELLKQQFGFVHVQDSDNKDQNEYRKQLIALCKEAVAQVADATRKNELPVPAQQAVKKDDSARAQQLLQVIEVVEAFTKN
jgi:hypothetical protein